MEEIYNHQNLVSSTVQSEGSVSKRGQHSEVKSRTSRRAFELAMTEQNQCLHSQYSSVCQNVNISEHRNKRFRETLEHSESSSSSQFVQTDEIRDSDQYSHSFGQASYQRSRQGLIVTYQDSGDNVYTCSHCNACFWSGEALRRSTSNGPLIYTNCCRKGQIKLGQSKPTPFLERLLDPNNGLECRTFRENIRVYNSMFSFTSMGAAIDRKINTGSGPYVFKISGQVHHLMGSILPSDGLCHQYAQLYIYDTKNEILNRLNAIDPTHVNANIKSNIIEGLIKMFDQINELVKEFQIIRDKFDSHSLPSLNEYAQSSTYR